MIKKYGGLAVEKIIPTTGDFSSTIYEVRRYQLVLGYDTVPKFIEHYSGAL